MLEIPMWLAGSHVGTSPMLHWAGPRGQSGLPGPVCPQAWCCREPQEASTGSVAEPGAAGWEQI